MLSDFLKIGPRIWVLPVIHGSGDFAVEVRRVMLSQTFDCLAVPLPPSFQELVERAIPDLPQIAAVVQREPWQPPPDWLPKSEQRRREAAASYVPIDPCQPVIAALRIAIQEHIPRAFIDLETARFEVRSAVLPDPYALKRLPLERFLAGVLPAIGRPPAGQATDRIVYMAHRLRQLERDFRSILLVCSITDWPWIKDAYLEQARPSVEHDPVEPPLLCDVRPQTLVFLLGELPFITGLYERARSELEDDENLSVDGLKQLVLETRDRYLREHGSLARRITPKLLATYFQYVRNLSLIHRRLTPDLYTLVIAAKQVAGDLFAVQLAETAREYPFTRQPWRPALTMSIGQARLPDGDVVQMKSRLPGPPMVWKRCELTPKPPRRLRRQWKAQWDPHAQFSWPPEDKVLENFRTRVNDAAKAIMGDDLARTEKFTTSLKDGIDIRETLRNWYTGDLYVKVLPPTRGNIDCCLLLFDSPADPRDYPWRGVWYAEHDEESTMAFYATDYREEIVGPGIALAKFGGLMMLFPPRHIPDIWKDPRFDVADTLEERLLLAACYYSEHPHIAVLSATPPGPAWRRIARRFKRKLVHVPLSRFSQERIQQIRLFHVLNGRHVRAYAAQFIRRP